MPRLSAAEWITFALLAAALSVCNVYTTLLTGIGDGGSILAVLTSVLVLRALTRQLPSSDTLNLGATMASAGSFMGFAVAPYAAVVMANPAFRPNPMPMLVFFIALGLVGTLIGAAMRRWMVKYAYPSGIVCAVIVRAVTAGRGPGADDGASSERWLRLLAPWGAIAGLATLLTRVTLDPERAPLLSPIALGALGLRISLEPLLYGIGTVVGPRIGIGLLVGGIFGELVLGRLLEANGIDPALQLQWASWLSISLLVLPTVVSIAIAMRQTRPEKLPASLVDQRTPAFADERAPMRLYGTLAIVGVVATVITAHHLFALPIWVSLAAIVLSLPLCTMTARVAGETDINPVLLVVAMLLALFLVVGRSADDGAVFLLGIGLIGGTLASLAVDVMVDYRCGYLLGTNPNHQTAVQLVGVVIGGVTAVPFILFLQGEFGFGAGGTLPAPGPLIYTTMAADLLRGATALSAPLIAVVIGASLAGAVYEALALVPRLKDRLPSLFGIGIGILLGFQMCAAIFVGSMIRTVYLWWHRRRRGTDATREVLLAGSAVFAAGALCTILALLVRQVLAALGLEPFHLAL